MKQSKLGPPPELRFSESGFLENWEEFDAWAKANVGAWRDISDRLYGRSECERACALAAVFCSFIWKYDHDELEGLPGDPNEYGDST